MSASFIEPHGGYENLKSYQKSQVILQATRYFCKRFLANNHRQVDQMVQAARSGKQNIVEGSLASATSKQSEIHLTNVAKASLGELKEDYEDFLDEQGLPIWDKQHPQAQELSKLSRQNPEAYETYQTYIEHESPEISANTIRHLTLQAIVILRRQVQHLEQKFLREGGTREHMTAARLEARATEKRQQCDNSQPAAPACPDCNAPMTRRKARKGPNAGNAFWGCSQYPKCTGTLPVETENKRGR